MEKVYFLAPLVWNKEVETEEEIKKLAYLKNMRGL